MNNQATRLIRLPEVLERTGYGKAWIYRLISEGRFPAPVKIGVRAYATRWEKEADAKKAQATAAGELTFYGLLTSAIGLATKSPETVIAGGSVGAAGTIYSKRYALDVQAHNYDLAAQSVQCMYMAALPYKDIQFADPSQVRDPALASLVNVRKKLRNQQNNLVLATPSFTELQAALMTTADVKANVASGSTQALYGVPVETEGEETKVDISALLKSLKVCESQTGG
jgi:predicted DNA-binding transcriptional regulator AlpA